MATPTQIGRNNDADSNGHTVNNVSTSVDHVNPFPFMTGLHNSKFQHQQALPSQSVVSHTQSKNFRNHTMSFNSGGLVTPSAAGRTFTNNVDVITNAKIGGIA